MPCGIWLKLDRMRAYKISSEDVMKAIAEQSIIGSPAGAARAGFGARCRNRSSMFSPIKGCYNKTPSSMKTSF